MLRRLGAVQLDTISVLARSHEVVAYARLGAVPRTRIERAYWGGGTFEYWSHAACVLPVEEWPMFAFRRRPHESRRLRSGIDSHAGPGEWGNSIGSNAVLLQFAINNDGQGCDGGFRRPVVRLSRAAK